MALRTGCVLRGFPRASDSSGGWEQWFPSSPARPGALKTLPGVRLHPQLLRQHFCGRTQGAAYFQVPPGALSVPNRWEEEGRPRSVEIPISEAGFSPEAPGASGSRTRVYENVLARLLSIHIPSPRPPNHSSSRAPRWAQDVHFQRAQVRMA